MSSRINGSPPFRPNHLTPKLCTSSTKCRASFVVISLDDRLPLASTLQYLQRALHAPVALQEVISKGPLFVKAKFPQILFADFIIYFKVSLDWIRANDINPDGIMLYSYKDSSWSPRPTQKIAEDEGYMYFSSQIESFDSVAITGRITSESSDQPNLLETTWFWILIGLLAGMIVVIVLVIIIRQYKKNQLNKLTSI